MQVIGKVPVILILILVLLLIFRRYHDKNTTENINAIFEIETIDHINETHFSSDEISNIDTSFEIEQRKMGMEGGYLPISY